MRLPGALCNYADVLVDLGEFEAAEAVLDRAQAAAEDGAVAGTISIAWSRRGLRSARAGTAPASLPRSR
jgi:hypothetical protein